MSPQPRRPFPVHRGPQYLYRLYAGEQCIYVGITENLKARLASHAHDKPWWPEVDRVEHEIIYGREEAMDAEQFLIRVLDPPHNVNGRGHRVRHG